MWCQFGKSNFLPLSLNSLRKTAQGLSRLIISFKKRLEIGQNAFGPKFRINICSEVFRNSKTFR